jgi:hypothetical protein
MTWIASSLKVREVTICRLLATIGAYIEICSYKSDVVMGLKRIKLWPRKNNAVEMVMSVEVACFEYRGPVLALGFGCFEVFRPKIFATSDLY